MGELEQALDTKPLPRRGYDAEFRYDREPLGALQGLAPERVVLAGTVSKTLAPGLRLGWLLLPAALVEQAALLRHVGTRLA